jgi:phosphatidylserine/phosphatidylglycerophosphate/cardiolipin synthase-like enzyme
MNMSDTSLDKNREVGILLLDELQIATFKKVFFKDWDKGIVRY